MKAVILAAATLAIGATTASAQLGPWSRDRFPYAEQFHAMCQEKAHRLYAFERRSAADGRLSGAERETIRVLQRDLDKSCGGYRFRG